MIHNEDSRVKIPAILHLVRLGYTYLPLKSVKWDASTNICTDLFYEGLKRLNPQLEESLSSDKSRYTRIFDEISLSLENEDLGNAFYQKLINRSGIRLIDFENPENNSYHVVTELSYQKDDESFRPDITLLVNGMPLVFIEVKIPNNKDGILAEHRRLETRFQNKKFRKFINITQFMVFSNNMEYDPDISIPIHGAFYATTSYQKPVFNFFREEETFDLKHVLNEFDDDIENLVLQDTNLVGIKNSQEFALNKEPDRPTNRISTSLFQIERLHFLLQYGITYVKDASGLQKHIMRYPQIFATKAIEKYLELGKTGGIIWHTQGSGKTALAFYNVKHLTDYYQKKQIVPKFYFIVDRIDLLEQAGREFKARGLVVHKIQSREKFAQDIKSTKVIHNDSGKAEITVVNIQKFQEDPDVLQNTDYQVNIQRIYFMDEVHRSYNPKGSFLANLKESDSKAIKIGLTGTPLIGSQSNSRDLFGGYIHKYYYNSSIADGYTLRLIREEIETGYNLKLKKTLEEIEILKGVHKKETVYAHKKFVEPMLDYIVHDFEKARIAMDDNTIGGMVVCDSSSQAKMMHKIFLEKVANNTESQLLDHRVKRAALILHDIGTKAQRKELREEFNEGKVDLLFVYNMLLTGFDAPRLKKLYLGRVVKSHNLLQTLTRVNRTYKKHRYGYVVDFAGIQSEFRKTSQAYFNELQDELGDELQNYSDLFLTESVIEEKISQIQDTLAYYDLNNAEKFCDQISKIQDRKTMQEIVRALEDAKNLYNLMRSSGNHDKLDKLDFKKLVVLSRDASKHLQMIHTKDSLDSDMLSHNLLNTAIEDILFSFTKVGEEEMILADKLREAMKKTREMLAGNFDLKDPEFISLLEELERLFKKKNLAQIDPATAKQEIENLNGIYDRARKLENHNQLIRAKYENDQKYARMHKRLTQKDPLTGSETLLFEALCGLKKAVDLQILQNSSVLENETYSEKMMGKLVIEHFNTKNDFGLDLGQIKRVKQLIVKEYLNEYNGSAA